MRCCSESAAARATPTVAFCAHIFSVSPASFVDLNVHTDPTCRTVCRRGDYMASALLEKTSTQVCLLQTYSKATKVRKCCLVSCATSKKQRSNN
ncbi:hypothetical protein BaRGS_00040508 [Batillaria attramentaria]|uniref:Secreted protein n=1 Tax=Batillaria attramentaria TaxID=370345 RepID=A0ABD0J020_9CAEN